MNGNPVQLTGLFSRVMKKIRPVVQSENEMLDVILNEKLSAAADAESAVELARTQAPDKLGDPERRVDGRFFKCHWNYLVNLDDVRGRRDGQVFLSCGERIPVSRLRKRELTQALLRCMKEREN